MRSRPSLTWVVADHPEVDCNENSSLSLPWRQRSLVWVEWMKIRVGMHSVLMEKTNFESRVSYLQLCKDFNDEDFGMDLCLIPQDRTEARALLVGIPESWSKVRLASPWLLCQHSMLDLLPQGSAATEWIALQNRIHTWLHQHPLNQHQATKIQAWLWGWNGLDNERLAAPVQTAMAVVPGLDHELTALAHTYGWTEDRMLTWPLPSWQISHNYVLWVTDIDMQKKWQRNQNWWERLYFYQKTFYG